MFRLSTESQAQNVQNRSQDNWVVCCRREMMCPMSVNMSGRLYVMSENSNVKYNVWKKINLFVIKKVHKPLCYVLWILNWEIHFDVWEQKYNEMFIYLYRSITTEIHKFYEFYSLAKFLILLHLNFLAASNRPRCPCRWKQYSIFPSVTWKC